MDYKKKKYVLLDRDGTIMIDKHYQKDPSLTELFPKTAAGMKKLADAGFGLVVITNQSGIARGYLAESDLAAVNASLAERLAESGVKLDGIYHCPHLPTDRCRCRKPLPGMVEQAAADLGFDARDAVVVGDRECDVELGSAVGSKTVLVRTGGGADAEREGQVRADYVADDLLDAANWILAAVPTCRSGSH